MVKDSAFHNRQTSQAGYPLLRRVTPLVFASVLVIVALLSAQEIPHGQDKAPGAPLTPEQALSKFIVPQGFAVELVAAEPDLVNPVAMTIDERGRFWITESLEYPRRKSGRGSDRIKIFEDTDGDGKFNRNTIFADGLNIPSGIAVGYGGVWVANAPDILFFKLGPDDKPVGKPQVVATGFGREDTHELPNSLSWGPDGWLYGLNGVSNPSVVKSNNGKTYKFTCATFRINPRTQEFQIFCEGTSNPWGIAWDNTGSAFASACVIDHLWHFVETGYYRRQSGAYPRFTWFSESIVDHHHQKAAYCGLHYFDSDAYPEQYRERLYMGNIHGACINVDNLHHVGSTYLATAEPDFLTANDPWFMPVSQKTGPDGCLYVLDWYDRYHCYQDAQRDSPGIDRKYGRLYRIRYKGTPRAQPFDLKTLSDDELITRLADPNLFFRGHAQRLLSERMNADVQLKLQSLVLAKSTPPKARMHALWALIGAGRLDTKFHLDLLSSKDATIRAWAVRATGDAEQVDSEVLNHVIQLAHDRAGEVRLQVAIAAGKIKGAPAIQLLLNVLANSPDDVLIPHVVWQNLYPLIGADPAGTINELRQYQLTAQNPITSLLPRMAERLLADDKPSTAELYNSLLQQEFSQPDALRSVIAQLNQMLLGNEVSPQRRRQLAERLDPTIARLQTKSTDVQDEASLLAVGLELPGAQPALLEKCKSTSPTTYAYRLRGIEMLLAVREPAAVELAITILGDARLSPDDRKTIVGLMGRYQDDNLADSVLGAYSTYSPEIQVEMVRLLTTRANWSKALLQAIGRKQLATSVLNPTQVVALHARHDAEIDGLIDAHWGSVRKEVNRQREQIVKDMRRIVRSKQGNSSLGAAVFRNNCAQCHKIFGAGAEVCPDLTSNGRNDFDQLLSNVFDPSLVIGRAYQSAVVVTTDGRTLTGLLTEENSDRVVLTLQGGKREVIRRDEIDVLQHSQLSLMPEGFEKQLSTEQIVDLFAFLALDRAPDGWNAGTIQNAVTH